MPSSKRMRLRHAVATVACILATGCSAPSQEKPLEPQSGATPELPILADPDQVLALSTEHRPLTIDTRPATAYQKGHIAGAVSFPIDDTLSLIHI